MKMKHIKTEVAPVQVSSNLVKEVLELVAAAGATEPKLPEHGRARLQAKVKETLAPVSGQQLYAVLYDGDTATGTPQTWQIWTQEQMEQPDSRVLEHYPIVNSQQYRACNCYEELVSALALCYTWAKEQFAAEMNKDDNEDNQTLMRDVCEQARAALNKASR